MAKFLNFNGLKRFKAYLDEDIKKSIKTIVGLDESEDELSYATNEDIDKLLSNEESGDGIIRLKKLSYYHNKLIDEVKLSGSDINASVQTAVADALIKKTDLNGNEVKSKIYENTETIIDGKLKWKTDFPN